MYNYLAEFPESLYPPESSLAKDYAEKILLGTSRASLSSVAILGLARNCGNILPYTISRINKLAQFFKFAKVFILENDSEDNTKDLLRQWEARNINIYSTNFDWPKLGNGRDLFRATKMAYLRNTLRNWFLQSKTFVDYIILLDMDLVGGWSYEGILNSIGHDNWDVIGSNSVIYHHTESGLVRLFYDTWAYRDIGDSSAKPDYKMNLLYFNRGQPLYRVWSCFGGLAIYQSRPFTYPNIQYSAMSLHNNIECEHVSFHTALRLAGFKNIFINPSQITLYSKTQYTI